MHADGRCICCGSRVKMLRGYYPLECKDCQRMSSQTNFDGFDHGACRASIHHELSRRFGYSHADGSGPRVPYKDEDKVR